MRRRGLVTFVFLATTGPALSSAAQSALQETPSPAQTRHSSVQVLYPPQDPAALQNPFSRPVPGQEPAESPKDAPRWRFVQLPGKNPDGNARPRQLPEMPLDPGIYLRQSAALDTRCAAIMSYNFSQGENPRLESITTCTPAKSVRTLKADYDKKQVQSPPQR